MSVRVMIVDDDPMIRRTLSNALARSGFDVCTASDGNQALRLSDVAPPAISVIDYNMPMGGVELVRRLKARHGEQMYVAILSGEDDDATRAACLHAGANTVLVKPISPLELRRQLLAAASALNLRLPVAS